MNLKWWFVIMTAGLGLSCNDENSPETSLPPSAPAQMAPVDGAVDQPLDPVISWEASSGATSYRLQVSSSEDVMNLLSDIDGLASTSRQIFGLSNGMSYYWRVNAANSSGSSLWSGFWSFATVGMPPMVPSLLWPLDDAQDLLTTLVLTWRGDNAATEYHLQVSTHQDFSSISFEDTGIVDTSYELTTLRRDSTFYWHVRATNRYGSSDWSPARRFTTGACSVRQIEHEGKTYHTVSIQDQCWLQENLDVGVMIRTPQSPSDNGVVEKYCFGDDSSNCTLFGGLYTWKEAMQYSMLHGAQGICPSGWHIPRDDEFLKLSWSVDEDGNALKEVGQAGDSGAGTNARGFSALFAGREVPGGGFDGLGFETSFWSSVAPDQGDAYCMILWAGYSTIGIVATDMRYGYSVRCLKD